MILTKIKLMPVPCPPQIPYELAWYQTWTSVVRGQLSTPDPQNSPKAHRRARTCVLINITVYC